MPVLILSILLLPLTPCWFGGPSCMPVGVLRARLQILTLRLPSPDMVILATRFATIAWVYVLLRVLGGIVVPWHGDGRNAR